MKTTSIDKPLGQFFLLGSNIAKLTWGKVGAVPATQQETIRIITFTMIDELGFPSSVRSELEKFLERKLSIKQLIEEVPRIKSLLGLYIGNSIGRQQMQAFYLGFNIVNAMPMCEMASIEIGSSSLKGATPVFEQLLSELIPAAQEIGLDASVLEQLLEQSRTAKTRDTFDKIRLRLIECGQSFAEELERIQGKPSDLNETKISILFLAADPTDASRLRLGEEFREINEQLTLAKYRGNFNLSLPYLSLRPKDISRALLETQPQIVHFSGHGTPTGALCFEDESGKTHSVQPEALSALFEQFSRQVKCVVLNACYAEEQAIAIAEHVDYVVGMKREISDKAAIAFSVGFYQALGAGKTVEEAFELGRIQIMLQGVPEHLVPVLIKKGETLS